MSIAVLEKSFRVLEAMSDLDQAASLKEVGAATRIPKPTLHRILQTLTDLGYVAQDKARSSYRLTPRLIRLTRGRSLDEVKERALPLMESLHARFNETVNLGVLQGAYIHYVYAIETTQNLRWQVLPGARDPYFSTALGRAIAAHLPEFHRDELIARTRIEPRTPFTVPGSSELEAILEETKVRGVAIDDEETDLGVICLGIPLLDESDPLAAISISVPKSRMTAALRGAIEAALLDIRSGDGRVVLQ
jgi:DNA-binding IclR family transcriptional regulator